VNKTVISGHGIGPQVDASDSFLISAVDYWGNKVTSGGLQWGLDFEPSCINITTHVIDNQDGTYGVDYTLPSSGAYCFEVTFGADVIGTKHNINTAGGSSCTGECLNGAVCSSGYCYCKDGFQGPNCAGIIPPFPEDGSSIGPGGIAGIVVGIIAAFALGLLVGCIIIPRFRGRRGGEGQPLLK